jgi:hypothetical protein
MNYFEKMKGHTQSPPRVGIAEIFWSWFGSFLGISVVALIHFNFWETFIGLVLLTGTGAFLIRLYLFQTARPTMSI